MGLKDGRHDSRRIKAWLHFYEKKVWMYFFLIFKTVVLARSVQPQTSRRYVKMLAHDLTLQNDVTDKPISKLIT